MNWSSSFKLVDLLISSYWNTFPWLYTFAAMLKMVRAGSSRYERPYWMSVKVFRFAFSVRKHMYYLVVIDIGVHVVTDKQTLYGVLLVIYFLYAFILKDNFGDDDRKKKPSKVKSFIKSLGHRLVVQPQ